MFARRKIRFGILGCGTMGRRHAEIIARHPHAELAAVCSRTPERARQLAREFGVRAALAHGYQLIERHDVDAVVIATHHDSHVDLALAAAAAGKPALIEKPLALSVAGCVRVVEAFENAEVPAGVVFNWRFSPVVREARRRVPAPCVLVGCMMDDRWPDDVWAQQPDVGGGNLTQGCHMADLLCFLAGGRPVKVSAQAAQVTHPDADGPDQLVASIRFDSGAIASWIQGDACAPHRGSKFQISLFQTGRSAEIYRRCRSATFRVGRRVDEMSRKEEEGLSLRTTRFIDDLVAEVPIECDLRDGLVAALLFELAIRAWRTGQAQPIAWKNGLPALVPERAAARWGGPAAHVPKPLAVEAGAAWGV